MTLHKDDKVHLTARYAAALPHRHRKVPTDLAHRVGTVTHVNGQRVFVIWDGRKSADQYDPRVLEKIT
jgi:hypothetical protein